MITNDDIKKLKTVFATKDDLKNFATKDDLKKYATKDDLTQLKDEIFDKMDENYSKVFNLVDGLAVEIKDGRESRAIFSYRIEDLEKRMKIVEKNFAT